MELSDVVLALVGIISAITGGVVKSLVADLKAVEKQISALPKEYVLKSEYHDDIKEIKHLIEKLFDKVNEK
jgi:cell division protein FtsB